MTIKTPVSVIVPVFNAFAESLLCAQSLLNYSNKDVEVIFIDDGSSEGSFEAFLREKLNINANFKFIRNATNLGFVKSCNLGMKESPQKDVILLNSDCIVTPGWIEKLARAAYSNKLIGTVTPLTNSGTIASFPNIHVHNEIPSGYSLNEFAKLVEDVSQKKYPHIPTCVGFCVYIKRELLNKIGLFDEDCFGYGYGEENDLSCRAAKSGYYDILDDTTYIYHKGSASFGADSSILKNKNYQLLIQKHPEYESNLEKFFKSNSLNSIHDVIFKELINRWSKSRKLNILHILHNGPYKTKFHGLGGTELLLQDLIQTTPDFAHWSLIPDNNGFEITAHMPGLNRELSPWFLNSSFGDLINKDYFDLIHVHHTIGIDTSALFPAIKKFKDYVVSVHDHHTACPRIYMLTPDFKHCSGHECVESCGYESEFITNYRKMSELLLTNARYVFNFSDTSKKLIDLCIKGDKSWRKIQHGINLPPKRIPQTKSKPSENNPLKIVCIGSLPKHKGSQLISEVASETKLANGVPLEWHLLGEIDQQLSNNVILHGEYTRESIIKKLLAINPHLALFASIAPESYGLTVDEAICAGIPVIVPPLGGPQERVSKNNSGWILPQLNKESVLDLLSKIASDWNGYSETVNRLIHVPLCSIADESMQYEKLYNTMVTKKESDVNKLLKYKEPILKRIRRKDSRTYQTLRRIKHAVISSLGA